MVGCAGNAPAGRKARRIYSPSRLFSGLTAHGINDFGFTIDAGVKFRSLKRVEFAAVVKIAKQSGAARAEIDIDRPIAHPEP